jgi:3-dehydroquinate synthase
VKSNLKLGGHKIVCDFAVTQKKRFVVKSQPRSYVVEWSENSPLKQIQKDLKKYPLNSVLIVDRKVFDLHLKNLDFPRDRIFFVEATESVKTFDQGLLPLLKFFDDSRLNKGGMAFVVGGGITQDLSGVALGLWRRGMPWTLYPSTLLAQCDSCIGGKTGLNFGSAKNAVGMFFSPERVVLLPDFLASLEPRERRSGLGEILKLAITGGPKALALYEKNKPSGNDEFPKRAQYRALVLMALAVKKSVIEKDEFEFGLRRVLNYGHTIGHVIESLSDFAIPHGHAVVAGMLIENEIAVNRRLTNRKTADAAKKLCLDLLDAASLQRLKTLSLNQVTTLIGKDKKAVGANVVLCLLEKPGHLALKPIPNDDRLKAEITEAFAMFSDVKRD